jgi:hypothetical protein
MNYSGHKINLIKKVGVISLFDVANEDTRDNEEEYLSRFKDYKLENCYFSYTYDLTNSLSKNMTRNAVQLFESDQQYSKTNA